MSYDSWKLRSPEDEQHAYDAPEQDGVDCYRCDHFIADGSGEQARKVNGKWYCADCAPNQVVQGLAEALRDDEIRDDALAMAGRIDHE